MTFLFIYQNKWSSPLWKYSMKGNHLPISRQVNSPTKPNPTVKNFQLRHLRKRWTLLFSPFFLFLIPYTFISTFIVDPLFYMSSVYNDHTSPMNSPMVSPIGSPYQTQGDWDQLQCQFSQQMSLQPPPNNSNGNISNSNNNTQQTTSMDSSDQQQNNKGIGNGSGNGNNNGNSNNTFVHKLHT